jgi:hypothetical protein
VVTVKARQGGNIKRTTQSPALPRNRRAAHVELVVAVDVVMHAATRQEPPSPAGSRPAPPEAAPLRLEHVATRYSLGFLTKNA